MNCTQDNDLMPLLIELGILPCLGILLLMLSLFYILVKYVGREKPEPYTDDDAIFDLFILVSITIILFVSATFLVGAIANNLLISMLSGQPIHWY